MCDLLSLQKLSVGQTPRLCILPSKSYSKINKKIIYSLSFFAHSLCFLTVLDCQGVRELIREGVIPKPWLVGLDCSRGREQSDHWSDLPLNCILYIPFSIFGYSSNICIDSLDLMDSKVTLGTLKYSRFFLSSSSFRDHTPGTDLFYHPSLTLFGFVKRWSERFILFLCFAFRPNYVKSYIPTNRSHCHFGCYYPNP